MKRVSVIVALAVLLSISANVALADFMTGKELVRKLGGGTDGVKSNPKDYAMAWGYIIGVFDAFNKLYFNAPAGVTQEQVKDIAIKYLRENPDKLQQPADTLLTEAFKHAFRKRK